MSPTRSLPLLILMAALLAANAVDGARLLRADADVTALASIWDPNDVCSQPIRMTKDGALNVTCDVCLTRPGCAVESTTGKCVSAARTNATMHVEYFYANQDHYCDATDQACSLCSADNSTSSAVCRGAKGCVCVHQCEVNEADASSSDNSSGANVFHVYYILISGAFLTTAIIIWRVYKALLTEDPTFLNRRQRAQAAHNAKPLTMKLEGWRGFMEKERQEQPEHVDIKLCPTRPSDLDADEAQRHPSTVSTEDDDDSKADDVEYVTVTTPRSGDANANAHGTAC